jgi:hypothetical protein
VLEAEAPMPQRERCAGDREQEGDPAAYERPDWERIGVARRGHAR